MLFIYCNWLKPTHTLTVFLSPPSGMALPALFLLINSYFGTNIVLFVVFLSLAIGSVGFATSGYDCNHLDIAPHYAGVLMGITNTAATIPGILGPTVAKGIANAV